MRKRMGWILAALATTMLSAGPVLADDTGPGSFLAAEYRVLGSRASTTWQAQMQAQMQPQASTARFSQIGDEGARRVPNEFGSTVPQDRADDDDGRPSQMGTGIKAGLLSAVLPGAGQFYNGKHSRAYLMGGIELSIWTAYFVFDQQGDSKREDAEEWAAIYAGTSGSHAERYWQSVGRYANSDAYNESLLREARATGETAGALVTGSDTWQWVNRDRQTGYSRLRADGNAAYDRRDFMILFAVLNRAVSVVDAVIGAGNKPGVLEAEVMGLNLEMQMLPSWRDPGARCVVSRSF